MCERIDKKVTFRASQVCYRQLIANAWLWELFSDVVREFSVCLFLTFSL